MSKLISKNTSVILPLHVNRNCFHIQWNPHFSKPHFCEPSDNSNQKSFPSPQQNTVILPPVSQTIWFFKPIFVSFGGSKNEDSSVHISVAHGHYYQGLYSGLISESGFHLSTSARCTSSPSPVQSAHFWVFKYQEDTPRSTHSPCFVSIYSGPSLPHYKHVLQVLIEQSV